MDVLSSLITNYKKLKRNDFNARVNRINWRFLEERVDSVFDSILLNGKEYLDCFGCIYLDKNLGDISSQLDCIPLSQRINSIHIHFGHRLLDVMSEDKKTQKMIWLSEHDAQLWYSQSPSGDVIVCIAPYASQVHKFDESEIVIGYFTNPSHISTKVIEGHFETFFKYCSCTSINSSASYSSYLYRRFLLLKDYRYKSKVRSQLFGFLERCVPLFVGVMGVITTLYVAGKLNL